MPAELLTQVIGAVVLAAVMNHLGADFPQHFGAEAHPGQSSMEVMSP